MTVPVKPRLEDCNCLLVRQAARHITQHYDRCLAPFGLRTTQFSILGMLNWKGALGINALAALLVMDRTTLGRNLLPLERDGLVVVGPASDDRRRKQVEATEKGIALFRSALKSWKLAQIAFDEAYGPEQARSLRGLLRAAAGIELGKAGNDQEGESWQNQSA